MRTIEQLVQSLSLAGIDVDPKRCDTLALRENARTMVTLARAIEDWLDNVTQLSDFAVGQRVELHPATNRWARGDRFGVVAKVGTTYLDVKLDRSGQTLLFHPHNVLRP